MKIKASEMERLLLAAARCGDMAAMSLLMSPEAQSMVAEPMVSRVTGEVSTRKQRVAFAQKNWKEVSK